MQECWYTLLLALYSPTFILPENAITALADGKIKKPSRTSNINIPEMIVIQADGTTWREIAEIYGYSTKNSVTSAVAHWKNKNK